MALREKQSIREISRRTGLSRNTIVMYDWLADICDDVVLAHPLKVKAIADAQKLHNAG